MNFDHLVDRLGDRLRSLPLPVQNAIGFAVLAAMSIAFVYAMLTPDSICVGCP